MPLYALFCSAFIETFNLSQTCYPLKRHETCIIINVQKSCVCLCGPR